MKLAAHGVAVDLPPGWEGAITSTPDAKDRRRRPPVDRAPVDHRDAARPWRLRQRRSVEDLGPDDAFVALLEYGPECAGTALFAGQGLPRRLRARDFNRRALQRTLDGQAGVQRFFTHAGRPFCLYVVLGRDHDLDPLLDRVHAALDGIAIT